MIELSLERFKEKYGHVKMKFTNYRRHTFKYKGFHEGNVMIVEAGGISNYYNVEIDADKEYALVDIKIDVAYLINPDTGDTIEFTDCRW